MPAPVTPSPEPSPSPTGVVGAANEISGTDREVSQEGMLESIVDQVLRLFLNV
jgi:hypothetical protein